MPEPAAGRYVVIGLGGIGSVLLRLLLPYLHRAAPRSTILAVDGDAFEEGNRERMTFSRLGPKPVVLAEELSELHGDRLTLLPVPYYVTPQRARSLIGEGDVVFCQPDNHATRRVVERRCARLRDVALFSGGNDGIENGNTGTFGNVQIYLRRAGRDVTNPLSAFHPEIAKPADRLPTQLGCADAAASAPQLIFTNLAVASAMLGAFYSWRQGRRDYEEAYLDVLTGRMNPVRRAVVAQGAPGPRRSWPSP
jgi:hypothetical protein